MHDPDPPAGVEPARSSRDRVLVLVEGERDRALLTERLGDRYEVVAGGPDGEWGQVDLCVVDAPTYRTVAADLARRRRESVAYLPVLLLVPDRGRPDGSEWVAEALDGPVDDVVVVPAPRHELDARVAALLRVRRQSRELALYRRAMDEATVGITISDPDREDNPVVYANDGFVEMTGYDRAEALGRNCRFLQGPDTDESTVAALREAIDAERPVVVELLNYRADGEPFWNRLTVSPVRDTNGRVTNFVGLQQDVTDQIERGRTLEEYETIVETATEPIFVVDPEGRFRRVNDAMVAATGRSREDLVGSHVSLVASDADVDRAERQVRAVLDGERDRATFEASLVAADGSSREYAMSASVLHDPDGFAGTAFVAHDVTDLREHQRRLSVLDRVLRHNLRNKLNVVLARTEEIAGRTDDETVREAAAAIRRAGEDLLGTSTAVRRFQGAVDPRDGDRTRVDVAETVDAAVEGLRATYPEVDVRADCPECAPVAGGETLPLAVEELLDRAAGRDAAPSEALANGESAGAPGLVEVDVTDRPGAGVVELVVADDGPGLSAGGRRALERGAETQLEHTSGLGLWLVRWTVENVGGEIEIEENDPHGTVVRLRLPRAPD
jgi:PAS domain S-box-containing protein